MSYIKNLYGDSSLSLLTDFYQFTMAYGYWKNGMANDEGVFHIFFRDHPFQGGYTIAAGLELAIDYLTNFKFSKEDIDYLKSLENSPGQPLFGSEFLDYLMDLRCTCDVDAIQEGTVVFPHEPLLRIRGPLLQCQLFETPLLNFLNFQSLVATKAARLKLVCGNAPILEFGLRRAQGIDGALGASRAAFIGGCSATSNTLAGKLLGLPIRGTHSHSWVMSFDTEVEAFEAFARALPDNTVFLVDTYDTLEGVRHAATVGQWLKAQGKPFLGIRLDSGDLAYLSMEARKILDQASLPEAVIVASNDLNEHLIAALKDQGSPIGVWGVGTQLVTAYDQPALGAVYKLAALKKSHESGFAHKIKISDQSAKTSTPGILQVRRYFNDQGFVADMILDELTPCHEDPPTIYSPRDNVQFRTLNKRLPWVSLLNPVLRQGRLVIEQLPSLKEIQAHAAQQLTQLHPSIRRSINPYAYPAGLEKNLCDLKTKMILSHKNKQQIKENKNEA